MGEVFSKAPKLFFNPFLITSLHLLAQLDTLTHLFIAVRMFELIVESLRQVVRDKPVVIGQEVTAVLGISQPGK